MKNILKLTLVVVVLVLVSCKDSTTEEKKTTLKTTISSAIEKAKEKASENQHDTQESDKALYKALKKKTPLTDDQLLATLPEHINGNKILGEYARQVGFQEAGGTYGSFDSAENTYTFWIKDGAGSKPIVKVFFYSYEIKSQGAPKTESVYTEHDGYKTFAFLQPEIKMNSIEFVYNNRFVISLIGRDSADALWSYIDFENLKKLDPYK